MINALNEVQIQLYEQQGQQRPAEKTAKVATNSGGDGFKSSNVKLNIKNAKKDGSLVYTEPTKLLGITLRNGYYTYSPKQGETLSDIKQKFGIRDGVISSMNSMYDDDYCPASDNKTVIFTLEDD